MLFGRRKPGYTTTVDSSVDPEQAVLDLQKAELAAKKKPLIFTSIKNNERTNQSLITIQRTCREPYVLSKALPDAYSLKKQ